MKSKAANNEEDDHGVYIWKICWVYGYEYKM